MKELLASFVSNTGAALEQWTKPVTILAGLISLVWGLLILPIQKPSEYLVVWITSDRVLYPSEVTSYKALPLNYSGTSVQSARILSVRIQNRGSSPIGKSENLWTLRLTAPSAANLVLLAGPKTSPIPGIIQQKKSSGPRDVVLEFGVFDSRSTVDLELLLVNTTQYRPLEAYPTLPGLPREISFESPSDYLANRHFRIWAVPILLLFSVLIVPPIFREWYERPKWKRAFWTPVYVVIWLIGIVIPAAIWVYILSHLVAWAYY